MANKHSEQERILAAIAYTVLEDERNLAEHVRDIIKTLEGGEFNPATVTRCLNAILDITGLRGSLARDGRDAIGKEYGFCNWDETEKYLDAKGDEECAVQFLAERGMYGGYMTGENWGYAEAIRDAAEVTAMSRAIQN